MDDIEAVLGPDDDLHLSRVVDLNGAAAASARAVRLSEDNR